MNAPPPILEFDSVRKSFAGVPVLKGISFSLLQGHTLGLVGENGAGKSTLMNILGGNVQLDSGSMRLDGQPYLPEHPRDAAQSGVAFIHQELNLFHNLSIAENLFLATFPTSGRFGFIDRSRVHDRAAKLLQQVGLAIAPETLVEKLSAGEQQLVEIAKALSSKARLIIFDEPATSLTARETERLFKLVADLRSRGVSLIYISHNLDHILRLCDDIVVLRDGELVGTGPKADFTADRLVSMMVGRSITQFFPPRPGTPFPDSNETPALLEVRRVSQPGIVADISFKLHPGEVLGLSGLMGAGRSELARILFGLDPFERGEILMRGNAFHPSPRRNIQRGLAFLSEDRRHEGLCLEASIADNIALVTLPRHAGAMGWISRSALRKAVDNIRQSVRLTPTAPNRAPARTLSGGNQQKVALAKWLLAGPAVFILDEPTRGIDVGAKSELYHLINDLAAKGAGIVVISSEIEELIGLCDRILVMSRGAIRDELPRAEFDRERILRAALDDRREVAT